MTEPIRYFSPPSSRLRMVIVGIGILAVSAFALVSAVRGYVTLYQAARPAATVAPSDSLCWRTARILARIGDMAQQSAVRLNQPIPASDLDLGVPFNVAQELGCPAP